MMSLRYVVCVTNNKINTMSKKIFLISILFAFCGSLVAQENDSLPDFKRHEIGISTGAFSLPSLFFVLSDVYPVPYEGYVSEKDPFFMYNIGSFSLSYRYHFTPHHSLGIVTTLLFSKIVDKNSDRNRSGVFTYWSLEPQYRITFHRRKNYSFYMNFSLGVTVRIASNEDIVKWDTYTGGWLSNDYGRFIVLPSTHITLFGVSLGKDNAANIELGIGTQGFLNVGYSRRF